MEFNFARLTGWAASLADKAGALGALVSAMGCAMCFPALASIGAAVGLGFLSRWEGMFVNTLLPAFALLVIIAQAIGWLAHRQWHRSLAGMIGPSLVLMSLYPWWQYGWSSWTFYGGLGLMLVVGVWDLVSPAHRHCSAGSHGQRRRPVAESKENQVHGPQ